MLTNKRRREIAALFLPHLGRILSERGIDVETVETFTRQDFIHACSLAGIPTIERDEILAELDATIGLAN